MAARTNAPNGPLALPSSPAASSSERADARIANARRALRFAKRSSIDFASQTVHVTTDANRRPIITDFTTQSAARYMPQGVRSRGRSAMTVLSWAEQTLTAPHQKPTTSQQILKQFALVDLAKRNFAVCLSMGYRRRRLLFASRSGCLASNLFLGKQL